MLLHSDFSVAGDYSAAGVDSVSSDFKVIGIPLVLQCC